MEYDGDFSFLHILDPVTVVWSALLFSAHVDYFETLAASTHGHSYSSVFSN